MVVGKDAVCRATVGNLARLMDEMVTALARCRQPKLAVSGPACAMCLGRHGGEGGGTQEEGPREGSPTINQ